jgi:hypothetical protein
VLIPAAYTIPLTLPNEFTASFNSCSGSVPEPRSATTIRYFVAAGMAFAVSRSLASLRASKITEAPASAHRMAHALPIPEEAPVTSITLPERVNGFKKIKIIQLPQGC